MLLPAPSVTRHDILKSARKALSVDSAFMQFMYRHLGHMRQQVLMLLQCSGVTRGELQSLQLKLSKWAAMAGVMSSSCNWWMYESMLARLAQQAAAGVRHELLKLMQIPSMTAANARCTHEWHCTVTLATAGCTSLPGTATCDRSVP